MLCHKYVIHYKIIKNFLTEPMLLRTDRSAYLCTLMMIDDVKKGEPIVGSIGSRNLY